MDSKKHQTTKSLPKMQKPKLEQTEENLKFTTNTIDYDLYAMQNSYWTTWRKIQDGSEKRWRHKETIHLMPRYTVRRGYPQFKQLDPLKDIKGQFPEARDIKPIRVPRRRGESKDYDYYKILFKLPKERK
jgi:hypothetical protein